MSFGIRTAGVQQKKRGDGLSWWGYTAIVTGGLFFVTWTGILVSTLVFTPIDKHAFPVVKAIYSGLIGFLFAAIVVAYWEGRFNGRTEEM